MTSDNLTTIAAWLGASGTVGLTLFEIFKYLKEKPSLKITCKFNREIYNQFIDGTLNKDQQLGTVWSIDLANNGTRTVIVTGVSVENHKGKDALITKDSIGHEIKRLKIEPGDSFSITISEKLLSSKNLKKVVVTSAIGKDYKKRIYFWQKR